jgi:hypothetical protein
MLSQNMLDLNLLLILNLYHIIYLSLRIHYVFLKYVLIFSNICPGGLKDKAVDSGSTDAGSIPARDANILCYGFLKYSVLSILIIQICH